MIHKTTVAVCTLTLALFTTLSIQAHNRYEAYSKTIKAENAQAQAKAEAAKVQAKQLFTSQVVNLDNLCKKDLAAYNAMTPANQAKTTKPNCTLQPVQ
jgi:hypothetical protein